ncbi:paraquat-inducible protein A [Flavimaricola marinus]|uniref:Inner membrane protein YebS n=1 Tax=Flavimaricola marinus TaxID=1819565 RepID=A0A238LJG4_9RHOB|nr:paraquat-inducible protein A [Flavimaricola marinus]SMY09535.1 Inner membrane protein YebS [Flavimaricola marinus]
MADTFDDLENLIACPHCDALYHVVSPKVGERAVCHRCHAVLIAPKRRAGMSIIMLALSVIVLVFGSIWFPFLTIHTSGFSNSATLLDAAFAFTDGPLLLLSLPVLALIVVIPLARVMLLIYVLWPVVLDRKPYQKAREAFLLSEKLRPWSMAEIFALGCAVALVKVADLALIGFGPAFYMFCTLVVIIVVQDNYMCRWSIWASLDPERDV